MLGRKSIFSLFVLLGVMQLELNAAYSTTELIQGGGSDTQYINKSKWNSFGTTYGKQGRFYQKKAFLYSTVKKRGSGLYQAFSTKIGKTYTVSAILIGADTNRNENFTGLSYLTISSAFPHTNGSRIIAQSSKVSGRNPRKVTFSFTARTGTSYLALRSNAPYKYSSARSLSVKESGSSQRVSTPTVSTPTVSTPTVSTPTVSTPTDNYSNRRVSLQRSNPIVARGNNIVIENKKFVGNGSNIAIYVNGKSNVTIRNCLFINFKEAISLNKSTNITITGNRFENGFTSIRALKSSNVNISRNEALNIGHTRVSRRANFVNFDKVKGGSVTNNRVENRLGQSGEVEDIVSVYSSHGRSGKPILIEGNWFRGRGTSRSGSCIMTGDNGGTYTLVRKNIGVNCGQVGLGIAGGSHNEISNNILVHTKIGYYSSAGIYVSAFKGYGGRNNVVKYNKINWWAREHRRYVGSSINTSKISVRVFNNTGWGWNGQDKSINENVLPRDLFRTNDKRFFSGRNK